MNNSSIRIWYMKNYLKQWDFRASIIFLFLKDGIIMFLHVHEGSGKKSYFLNLKGGGIKAVPLRNKKNVLYAFFDGEVFRLPLSSSGTAIKKLTFFACSWMTLGNDISPALFCIILQNLHLPARGYNEKIGGGG